MTRKQIERIEKDLNWLSEQYQKHRDAGYDKDAENFRNRKHGMEMVLAVLGYDTDYIPETFKWEIVEVNQKQKK